MLIKKTPKYLKKQGTFLLITPGILEGSSLFKTQITPFEGLPISMLQKRVNLLHRYALSIISFIKNSSFHEIKIRERDERHFCITKLNLTFCNTK